MCNFDIDLDSLPDEINPEEVLKKSTYRAAPKFEEEKLEEQKDEILISNFEKKSYDIIKKASDIKILPSKSEVIRMITKRSFNVIAFVNEIMNKHEIKELIIAVYSIDLKTLMLFEKYLNEKKIGKFTFLISNLRLNEGDKKANFIKSLPERFKNFDLIYAYSHCKIITCRTSDENYFTIEGSGNFSSNARIEQYSFENEKSTFDFHKKWISEIEGMSAKKDVLRYGSL